MLIRWSLQRGLIVLPKSAHRDRIAHNADVFNFELSEEEMVSLDGLDRTSGTGPVPPPGGMVAELLPHRHQTSGHQYAE